MLCHNQEFASYITCCLLYTYCTCNFIYDLWRYIGFHNLYLNCCILELRQVHICCFEFEGLVIFFFILYIPLIENNNWLFKCLYMLSILCKHVEYTFRLYLCIISTFCLNFVCITHWTEHYCEILLCNRYIKKYCIF